MARCSHAAARILPRRRFSSAAAMWRRRRGCSQRSRRRSSAPCALASFSTHQVPTRPRQPRLSPRPVISPLTVQVRASRRWSSAAPARWGSEWPGFSLAWASASRSSHARSSERARCVSERLAEEVLGGRLLVQLGGWPGDQRARAWSCRGCRKRQARARRRPPGGHQTAGGRPGGLCRRRVQIVSGGRAQL